MRLGTHGGWRYALGGAVAGLCAAMVGVVGLAHGGMRPTASASALTAGSRQTAADPTSTEASPVTTPAPTSTTLPPTTSSAPVTMAPPATVVSVPRPPVRVHSAGATRALPPGRGGTWAVVLGVDDYGGNGDLQAAVADANEVVSTLVAAKVPGENILLLRNSEVTPASIVAASDWLVDHAGEDGLAVFVWAGHVRELASTTEALATGNGGLVTDATLASHFSQLRSRRSWFLIAGCYAGGFTELLGPGRLLTAASAAHQEAYENKSLGHSYVVEYVVRRGLHDGEGPKIVAGSVTWAQQRLEKEHPGRDPYDYASGPIEPFVLGPNPTPTPAELAASPS